MYYLFWNLRFVSFKPNQRQSNNYGATSKIKPHLNLKLQDSRSECFYGLWHSVTNCTLNEFRKYPQIKYANGNVKHMINFLFPVQPQNRTPAFNQSPSWFLPTVNALVMKGLQHKLTSNLTAVVEVTHTLLN